MCSLPDGAGQLVCELAQALDVGRAREAALGIERRAGLRDRNLVGHDGHAHPFQELAKLFEDATAAAGPWGGGEDASGLIVEHFERTVTGLGPGDPVDGIL